MVPALSSSEKTKVGRVSILAFFGSKLSSLADNRTTDITLEGQDPVFLRVAKMTLIIPEGGLEGAFFLEFELVWLSGHKNDARVI